MKNLRFALIGCFLTLQFSLQGQWNTSGTSDNYTFGKVGIGTDSPSEKLEVKNGKILINDETSSPHQLIFGNSNHGIQRAGNIVSLFTAGSDGGISLIHRNWDGTGFNNLVTNFHINSSGKVGIGTIDLTSKFNVLGQDVDFYSGTLDNTLRIGRDIEQNFRLHINDNHGFLDLNQDQDENGDHVLWIRNLTSSTSSNNDIRLQTSGEDRLNIKSNGNIGIGTLTPNEKLEVKNGRILIDDDNSSAHQLLFGNELHGVQREGNVVSLFTAGNDGAISMVHRNWDGTGFSSPITNLHITSSGDVGIGTDEPDAKLAVAGKIHAEEVKVSTTVPAPDYVFEEDYPLATLDEIKAYITENKHLPEVPSAKEMKANGIKLGEMNMLLLKKIEELTLHMIDMKKEIIELKEKNEELEARLDQ